MSEGTKAGGPLKLTKIQPKKGPLQLLIDEPWCRKPLHRVVWSQRGNNYRFSSGELVEYKRDTLSRLR